MQMRQSSKTVRIRGIAPTIAPRDFEEFANKLCIGPDKKNIFSRSGSQAKSPPPAPLLSLAAQNDSLTGTISFTSVKLKKDALEKNNPQWTLDDAFDGLTILHAPENATLDICAVHGLGGNAFDTWASPYKMWLRDLLPHSDPFDKARIMTYGYDSALINSKSLQHLHHWADDLLRQVGFVRVSDEERRRPIIFVCHSMGGIVARESMVRLNRYPEEFAGLNLRLCGLLFMATPHSGTTLADWNKFLIDILDLTIGVRGHAIVDILKSFNSSAVESQKEFSKIRKESKGKYPVIKCLCESSKTRVGGGLITVVTQSSAGLDGETAVPILDVDHRDICKFETVFGGYMIALDMLKTIKNRLIRTQPDAPPDLPQNIPGRPRITTPHFPRDPYTPYYEGDRLRYESSFIGRDSEMDKLMKILSEVDESSSKFIGLVGTGGIGKTEILLELALQLRKEYNIFFVRVNQSRSLQAAFLSCANSIGHNTLDFRYPGRDTFSIWTTFSAAERVSEFKYWLKRADHRRNILIVDDLDAIEDRELINEALPQGIPIALFSTRDPKLCREYSHRGCSIYISKMTPEEIVAIMRVELEQLDPEAANDVETEELELVAEVVDGHPLAACHAISYIIDILSLDYPGEATRKKFVEIFKGPDCLARKRFLEYKPSIGISLMETFEISLHRLRQYRDEAEKLLYLIAFMGNCDNLNDLRHFFSIERPWLGSLQDELLDPDILPKGYESDLVRGEFFNELKNVSIVQQSGSKTPLQIHPLWIECMKQRAGPEGRSRWMHQLFHLCWNPGSGGDIPVLHSYRKRWISVATMFDISFPTRPDSGRVLGLA